MRWTTACITIVLTAMTADAANVLERICRRLPEPAREVIKRADTYRLQIIYTQVDRDRTNRPSFTSYTFRLNAGRYFYPASLVKLPMAVLALDKLNTLGLRGVDRHARVRIPAGMACQTPQDSDEVWLGGAPTLSTYISRMLLVSDNLSFNRVFEFVGRDHAAENLSRWGFKRIAILHRLAPCDTQQNRFTSPVAFLDDDGRVIYEQPPLVSHLPGTNPLGHPTIGSARMENGVLVPGPLDCGSFNYVAIEDIHLFLVNLIFPGSLGRRYKPFLTGDDYHFLRTAMCVLPGETGIDAVDGYPVNYKKYLLYGDSTINPRSDLRSFNVVGRAYGFLCDVAYVADFRHKIEFFLSAVIYVNEDDVVNTDHYEYETVGLPFLTALGKAVYDYERTRHRRHEPNLRDLRPKLEYVKIR